MVLLTLQSCQTLSQMLIYGIMVLLLNFMNNHISMYFTTVLVKYYNLFFYL